MKRIKVFINVLTLLCILSVNITYAQQKQSSDAVRKLQGIYNSYGPKQEITFEQFLKINNRTLNPQALLYTGCGPLHTPCGNGDFESGLDTTQWQGAYGTWQGGDPDPSTLTDGFISGPINDFNAHQTIVTTGIDPNVGISTTNSNNSLSTQSLRLGNDINGYGTELISKNITVSSALTIVTFYYALVFQDPQHPPLDQPAFSVRVFDCATGQELTGVCDLGNGSNKAVSDRNNPFFKCATTFCDVLYRDWTRAQIDLSAYIGKTVNIQFLNKDCGQGGHYGYTYLDDVCGTGVTNPFGIFTNASQTDSCGVGEICADYILPKTQGINGEAVINLNIYQSGNLVKTVSSDTLRTDSSTYCFSVNPATLGIDTSLGGFDYTLVGNFSINGVSLSPQTIGNPPDGQTAGQNNDYYTAACPGQGNAPFFIYPPTPTDGTTFNVVTGQNVSFTVQAADSDSGDLITLTATGLPGGATTSLTKEKPAALALPATGNPVSSTFSWTPTSSDIGTYVVQYIATDNTGLSSTTNIIISVGSQGNCDTTFHARAAAVPKYTVKGQAYHTIYKGYGLQRIALMAVHNGGTAPYKYQWSDGSTAYIHIVSPDSTTTYNLTITDAKGCTGTCSVTIYVIDVRCSTPGDIFICYYGQTMSVPKAEVKDWLDKGATLGSCNYTPLTSVNKASANRSASVTDLKKVVSQPDGSFIIYPNPAKNSITLRWNAAATNNAKVVITDLQGRILISQSVTGSSQNITINQLTSGVYIAKLVHADKTVATKRFIVNK